MAGLTKPTRADLLAAQDKTILGCDRTRIAGAILWINPGLYSGATGHHFARPATAFG